MSKKVLFVTGRMNYPFQIGGAGISMHTLLKEMHNTGFNINTIGPMDTIRQPYSIPKITKYLNKENIPFSLKSEMITYQVPYKSILISKKNIGDLLRKYLKNNNTSVVFTQLENSENIIEICELYNIPVVLFIRDAKGNNVKQIKKVNSTNTKTHIIFNSQFTERNYSSLVKNINSSVLYPVIDSSKYKLDSIDPKYITMINPVPEKGGEIVWNLAKSFPNVKFQLVEGWYPLNKIGIPWDKLDNIKMRPKVLDIKRYYQKTKVLIVPSQWDEAFGRVAVEGLIAGLPVLASNVGGLIESTGGYALYVDDYKNTESWVKKLKSVLSNELERPSANDIFKHIQKFSPEKSVQTITNVVEQLSK